MTDEERTARKIEAHRKCAQWHIDKANELFGPVEQGQREDVRYFLGKRLTAVELREIRKQGTKPARLLETF